MVVLLDLDDKVAFDPHADPLRLVGYPAPIKNTVTKPSIEKIVVDGKRPNPNINGFSTALGCYP